MTPHTKAATIIAPFLLIGGYIAADYFQTSKEEKLLTSEAQKTAAYELELSTKCKIPEEVCVLRKDGLLISIKTDNRNFYIVSNMQLEGATLGLAQSDRVTRGVTMQSFSNNKHWQTAIRTLSNLNAELPLLMRIALVNEGTRYYAEFPITHSGPWGTD
ncbi:MAG: hypothetical protein KAJ95_05645 [Gammaproteobacteria bacterium]|nr:hypothetical protein [Gammaproteobacteria bacterium]